MLIDSLILIVGITLLIWVLRFRAVLSLQFPQTRASLLKGPVKPPEGSAELYQQADNELQALGFSAPRWVLNQYRPEHASTVRLHAVQQHGKSGTLVWMAPPIDLERPNRLLTYFTSRLQDGRWAVTQISDPFFESVADELTPAQTIAEQSLEACLDRHLEFVAGLGSETDRQLDPQMAMLEFAGDWQMQIRDRLVGRQQIIVDGETARPGFRFGWQLLSILRKRPKSKANTEPVPANRLSGLAMQFETLHLRTPSSVHERFLFFLSALLFLLLGSPLFGFQLTLILFLVIAFHEGGHWLAMRLFGYHNPQITLLPLLGGVTMGHENDPDPAKRAWVSLAGPLPGILLGWLLVVWLIVGGSGMQGAEWLTTLIAVLLIINYLNILPIPPLDGSHVVRALLPPRWLGMQMLAVVLGVLLAAALGFAFDLWIITFISLFQLLLLPHMARTVGTVKALAGDFPGPEKPRALRIKAALQALESRHGPATLAKPRIEQALEVVNLLGLRRFSHLHRLLIAGVFALLLIVPVAGLVVFAVLPGMDGFVDSEIDYEAELERQETRRQALQSRAGQIPLARLIQEINNYSELPAAANELSIAKAEDRLGDLPKDLKAIYRLANGIPDLGLGPVEDIVVASESGDAVEFLSYGLYEGKHSFIVDNLFDQPLDVSEQKALGWWSLGAGVNGDERVFWSPTPVGGRFQLIDYFLESPTLYNTIDDWLRQAWVGEQMNQEAMAEVRARQEALALSLADSGVDELLARFPEPSLVERYLLQVPAWPEAATEQELATLAARTDSTLPPAHLAVLEQYNGFPPLNLLASDQIYLLGNRLPAQDESLFEQLKTPFAVDAGGPDINLSSEDIDNCWVIGGFDARQFDPDGGIFPNLLWCPGQAPGGRPIIDLGQHQTHTNFIEYLRESVVRQTAYLPN